MSGGQVPLLPGVDVSRETERCLQVHLDLLRRWTARINLVAPASLDDAWRRHVLDSAQLWPLRPARARHWADLGSGAGFPGLVLAILGRELQPDLRFTLVEADRRKAAFLSEVARATGVAVRIATERIERLAPLGADCLSARALAPLPALLALAAPHLAQDGMLLLPKGRKAAEEIAEARRSWSFALAISPSLTDTDGVLLSLTGLARA